jgi:hypothetical protein
MEHDDLDNAIKRPRITAAPYMPDWDGTIEPP